MGKGSKRRPEKKPGLYRKGFKKIRGLRANHIIYDDAPQELDMETVFELGRLAIIEQEERPDE